MNRMILGFCETNPVNPWPRPGHCSEISYTYFCVLPVLSGYPNGESHQGRPVIPAKKRKFQSFPFPGIFHRNGH